MTNDQLAEATAVLQNLLEVLSGTLDGATGNAAANLYYGLGDLSANAASLFFAAQIGQPLSNVFSLAVTAGATVSTMEQVRLAMQAETPIYIPGIALANAGVQMALASEVMILAGTTFTSRQDVDAALAALNDAFDSAEEYAADSHDPTVYQALIGAHAAAVRDLTSRGRPLPKLVTYSFPRVMTSHALANRLYGDASRCDELVTENKVVCPAFVPATGVALSK